MVALPPVVLALLGPCAVAFSGVLVLLLRVQVRARAVELACGPFCAVEVLPLAALLAHLAVRSASLWSSSFASPFPTPQLVPSRALCHFVPFQRHDGLAFSSVELYFLLSLAHLLARSASLMKAGRVSSWASLYHLSVLAQPLVHSDSSQVKVDRVFSSVAPPLLLTFLHFCFLAMVDHVSFEVCPPALQIPLAHLL